MTRRRNIREIVRGGASLRECRCSQRARKELDGWPASRASVPAWPDLELDELIHRMLTERNIAYAPLIITLRSAH